MNHDPMQQLAASQHRVMMRQRRNGLRILAALILVSGALMCWLLYLLVTTIAAVL